MLRSHPRRRLRPRSGLASPLVLLIAVAVVAAVAAATSPNEQKEDVERNFHPSSNSNSDLDTDREAVVLNVAAVRPVGSYLDTISVHAVSNLELGGMRVHTVNDMAFDMKTVISDRSDGAHQFTMTLTSVRFDLVTLGASVSCDSRHPKPASSSSKAEQDLCSPWYALGGSTIELVVDDAGRAADAAEPTTAMTSAAEQPSDPTTSSSSPLAELTEEFFSTNRMLNLVAEHPVAPGDTWDASQDDDMGSFQGTATLLGYKLYDNHDVAVIDIVGTTIVDMDQWRKSNAGLASGVGSDFSVEEMEIHSTIYFDPKTQFARFTAVDVSYAMHMASPLDGSDLTVPIQETITMTTELTKN